MTKTAKTAKDLHQAWLPHAAYVATYIHALLPPGWRVSHGPELVERDGLHVVISAEGPRGEPAGIRHPVEPSVIGHTAALDNLAAELGHELRRACESKAAPPPIAEEIRFALEPGACAPTRGSDGASGYDLYAMAGAYVQPGQIVVIDTGVRIDLPRGFEGQVRPRSGMTSRGLWVALGTIDQDYRGTIGATLINHARDAQKIEAGDRVAQLVIARVEHVPWVLVEAAELTETARGDRGWGSTGR